MCLAEPLALLRDGAVGLAAHTEVAAALSAVHALIRVDVEPNLWGYAVTAFDNHAATAGGGGRGVWLLGIDGLRAAPKPHEVPYR